MAVGSIEIIEIKQMQRTMNSGGVAEAEQMQLLRVHGGSTPFNVQYSGVSRV